MKDTKILDYYITWSQKYPKSFVSSKIGTETCKSMETVSFPREITHGATTSKNLIQHHGHRVGFVNARGYINRIKGMPFGHFLMIGEMLSISFNWMIFVASLSAITPSIWRKGCCGWLWRMLGRSSHSLTPTSM